MAKITQTLVSYVSISESKEETVTHGTSYKFTRLNQSIIRSLWETGDNFALKNPNQVRLVEFERGFRGLPQYQISDIEDSKP